MNRRIRKELARLGVKGKTVIPLSVVSTKLLYLTTNRCDRLRLTGAAKWDRS